MSALGSRVEQEACVKYIALGLNILSEECDIIAVAQTWPFNLIWIQYLELLLTSLRGQKRVSCVCYLPQRLIKTRYLKVPKIDLSDIQEPLTKC